MRSYAKKLVLGLGMGAWLLAVGAGFGFLFHYAGEPGPVSATPRNWPEDSRLSAGADTLLLFLHPQCPCSSATMTELERILPHSRNRVRTIITFVQPTGLSPDLLFGRLRARADRLPGVEVVVDPGGREAALFGAKTSGHALLFSASKLVYTGGITPARGHEGDSAGRRAILAFLQGGEAIPASAPVFGCSLESPGRLPAGDHHAP
jgi:hypothetical protein